MPGVPAGQPACSGTRLTIAFKGIVTLFERRFLNIKVSLSEDTLDNFKVLRLLCREVLFLCLAPLVLLPRRGLDENEYMLHHDLLFLIYN